MQSAATAAETCVFLPRQRYDEQAVLKVDVLINYPCIVSAPHLSTQYGKAKLLLKLCLYSNIQLF